MTTAYDEINYDESEREFAPRELHPKGVTNAVCVDVIDEGKQENPFKKDRDGNPIIQRRIRLVWETSKKKNDGRNWTISRSCSLSLYAGENGGNSSALYGMLSSWLGESWDGRFYSKLVVGRTAQLSVSHEPSKYGKNKGQMIAKVVAVFPLEDGETFEASGFYKRFVAKSDKDDLGF